MVILNAQITLVCVFTALGLLEDLSFPCFLLTMFSFYFLDDAYMFSDPGGWSFYLAPGLVNGTVFMQIMFSSTGIYYPCFCIASAKIDKRLNPLTSRKCSHQAGKFNESLLNVQQQAKRILTLNTLNLSLNIVSFSDVLKRF